MLDHSSMSDLQLACNVATHHGITTDVDRMLADIFNISPINERGHPRSLGYLCGTYIPTHAVFWVAYVQCIGTCSIRSKYAVMLLDVHDSDYRSAMLSYTFIIHPQPIDKLYECRRFSPPRLTVITNNSDVEISPIVGGDCRYYDEWYHIELLSWLPR